MPLSKEAVEAWILFDELRELYRPVLLEWISASWDAQPARRKRKQRRK